MDVTLVDRDGPGREGLLRQCRRLYRAASRPPAAIPGVPGKLPGRPSDADMPLKPRQGCAVMALSGLLRFIANAGRDRVEANAGVICLRKSGDAVNPSRCG